MVDQRAQGSDDGANSLESQDEEDQGQGRTVGGGFTSVVSKFTKFFKLD